MGNPTQDAEILTMVKGLVVAVNKLNDKLDDLIAIARIGATDDAQGGE